MKLTLCRSSVATLSRHSFHLKYFLKSYFGRRKNYFEQKKWLKVLFTRVSNVTVVFYRRRNTFCKIALDLYRVFLGRLCKVPVICRFFFSATKGVGQCIVNVSRQDSVIMKLLWNSHIWKRTFRNISKNLASSMNIKKNILFSIHYHLTLYKLNFRNWIWENLF